MATIQTRTNKAGRTTYRVGFYEDGRFQWLPALAHEAGAQRIKAIVEDPRQGPTVARRILEAQVDSAPGMPTLAEFFPRYIEHRGLRCTPGTLAGYEAEAARTFLPRLGQLPVTAIDRPAVQDWIRWQMTQPTARSRAGHARPRAATAAPTAAAPCGHARTGGRRSRGPGWWWSCRDGTSGVGQARWSRGARGSGRRGAPARPG